MHIEQFSFNSFQTRCSVVWDNDNFCAFIDPGCLSEDEVSRLTEFVASRNLKPVCIMLTHAHFDHIFGVSALSEKYGINVYMHNEEQQTLKDANPLICGQFGLPLPDTSFLE